MSAFLTPLEPLTSPELDKLQVFEAEVARGLVHRPGYAADMAKLRQRWEAHPSWLHGQPASVRVSTNSPYVTGGASSTQEEVDAVSDMIREKNGERERQETASPLKSVSGIHEHNFDRLHGLCRCGETKQ